VYLEKTLCSPFIRRMFDQIRGSPRSKAQPEPHSSLRTHEMMPA
jgi:hypothetical protein